MHHLSPLQEINTVNNITVAVWQGTRSLQELSWTVVVKVTETEGLM
jgi:hypothetical protein